VEDVNGMLWSGMKETISGCVLLTSLSLFWSGVGGDRLAEPTRSLN
jgi:hypothetical protein